MNEPLSKEDQAVIDAVSKASYDTLHTGRFMVDVNLTDYTKRVIATLLEDAPPDIIEHCRREKQGHHNATNVIVLVEDPNGDTYRMGWFVLEPTVVLEPEVAATMLRNLSNAKPLKTVPFPASPQLDWFANWATYESLRIMAPGVQGTKPGLPNTAVNIVHGLFCKTDIVVILAVLLSKDPQRVSFNSVSEATLTPDGKLVPTFTM